MILTGPEIERQVSAGRIVIEPFEPKNINPNSYNFRLGTKVKQYSEQVLDPAKPNNVTELEIPESGLELSPAKLYLGHISERIGSDYYVPIIKGRSSIGRLGIYINITADLIDQGAFGCWTMQLHAVQPAVIYPGMLIGQMTFWKPLGRPLLYSGKYQGAVGPVESLSYRDLAI